MPRLLNFIRFLIDHHVPLAQSLGGRLLNFLFQDRHTRLRPYHIKAEGVPLTLWLDWQDYTHTSYILLKTYEPAVVRFLKRTLKNGDYFVDAGANVGYFSLLAWKLGASVIAIEPMSTNLLSLRKNLPRRLGTEIEPVALSDRPGEMELRYRMLNAGSPSTVGMFGSGEQVEEYMKSETVPVDTLDNIIKGERLGVHFNVVLKLDIQGAELLALKGATNTLDIQWIKYIICEYNLEPDGPELVRFLADFGYHPYHIQADGKLGKRADALKDKDNYVFLATVENPVD